MFGRGLGGGWGADLGGVYIFLDGAGNLNATCVVFFFIYAEEATGVPILLNALEPSEGKTALDCNFAHQKGHADIVNWTGVDSINAAQFWNALDMCGGVAGNTNMVIKYDRDYQPKIKTASGQSAGLSRCLMMEFSRVRLARGASVFLKTHALVKAVSSLS